jgi:hypothetical protein
MMLHSWEHHVKLILTLISVFLGSKAVNCSTREREMLQPCESYGKVYLMKILYRLKLYQ